MDFIIRQIENMDVSYEMANGKAHFDGKKADLALCSMFRELPAEQRVEIAKKYEDKLKTVYFYTYIGNAMKKTLEG